MREFPLFFDLGKDRLFAVHHRPPGRARRCLVLCHALAEEKLWAHRVYVSLARELAERGFAVLRFDFRGEGDSDLEFEQTSLATRVEDALAAAALLAAREPGVERCIFLGHRLGCAVAARAAARAGKDAEALIAWDPVEDGTAYLMQWLRAALAGQLVATGKAPTRASLMKALSQGQPVTIDGWGIGPALYRELTGLEWQPLVAALACPVLSVEGACEPPFWRQTPRMHMRAPAMTERSLQWLEARATEASR